jgi:hypothetical protein
MSGKNLLSGSMQGHEASSYLAKGGCYALDDLYNTCSALVVGTDQRLHDWRIHSCFAGYSNRRGADQGNFGTQSSVTVAIGEKRGMQQHLACIPVLPLRP